MSDMPTSVKGLDAVKATKHQWDEFIKSDVQALREERAAAEAEANGTADETDEYDTPDSEDNGDESFDMDNLPGMVALYRDV